MLISGEPLRQLQKDIKEKDSETRKKTKEKSKPVEMKQKARE